MVDKCPDCSVEPGVVHEPGCDVERCKLCGWQAIGCNCPPERDGTTWTGKWPGELECEEFDLMRDPSAEGYRVVPWDFNELATQHANGQLKWDVDQERLVK